MRELILKFLKPYVLQIVQEGLVITKNKISVVDVKVSTDPPPPDPTGPIIPFAIGRQVPSCTCYSFGIDGRKEII